MSTVRPVDAWFVRGGADVRVHTSYPLDRREQIKEDGEARVRLEEPLSFIVQFSNGERKKYTIKAGYISDGVSKPWFAKSFLGPSLGGDDEPAAFAHDILCEALEMDARDAGVVFCCLMENIDVPWLKRRLQWRSVHWMCQPIQNRYPPKVTAFAVEHLEITYA